MPKANDVTTILMRRPWATALRRGRPGYTRAQLARLAMPQQPAQDYPANEDPAETKEVSAH
jgi:hypothetical protein